MSTPQEDIETYIESAENAYDIFGGAVVFFAGSIILLSNEIQTAVDISLFTDTHVWVMRFVGFVFIYVSVIMMTFQWLPLFQKIPIFTALVEKKEEAEKPLMAFGLTLFMILLGWFLGFVPYVGYLFAIFFVFGYFHFARRLSQSKSGGAKIVFILMMLFVFLILLGIMAFIYLTRAG